MASDGLSTTCRCGACVRVGHPGVFLCGCGHKISFPVKAKAGPVEIVRDNTKTTFGSYLSGLAQALNDGHAVMILTCKSEPDGDVTLGSARFQVDPPGLLLPMIAEAVRYTVRHTDISLDALLTDVKGIAEELLEDGTDKKGGR